MAVITMPMSPPIAGIKWTPPDIVGQVNRSEFTGKRKVTEVAQATRWIAEFSPGRTLTIAEARAWRGFRVMLKGPVNTCYLIAEKNVHALAECRVNGALTQGDEEMDVDGMTVGTDYFDIGHLITVPLTAGYAQLLMVTGPVASDGSGEATIPFLPALRGDVNNNALLETKNPYAEMALVEPLQSYFQGPRVNSDFTFEMEEVY